MSVLKLTRTISLALSMPVIALLALSVEYAGGLNLAIGVAGALAIAFQAAAYLIFSSQVAKPLTTLASSAGGGSGLPPPGTTMPSEIESLKTYVLSASALLDEYREQHRDLLMSVPDILLETDRDGKILFVNRAASEATGYPEEDVAGRHFLDFISPSTRGKAMAAFASVLAGKPASNVELELMLSDGSTSFFEFNAVPLWKDGTVAGCCCTGRDIDERRKIMAELEAARRHSEEATLKLKKTVSDLEEFSLLAVRRELKMQELREMFVRLKEEHEIHKEFPG